ncbi:MAG: glycosyltransferase, partial [Vicinamibacterales bacterium]|nr:glycosyltransferase [Vicinamibacterales bacterium]
AAVIMQKKIMIVMEIAQQKWTVQMFAVDQLLKMNVVSAMVQALMTELKMPADRFWFTGGVPEADLATFYRTASAYVSLSEHEGFCVPLLEAMAADVPVLAYAATAVPETLGEAGVQFAPKNLEYAAELLGLLVYDDDLRASVLAGQRARLADFSDAAMRARLARLIARFS